MLDCRKGRVCLFQGLLLLGFIGCSSVFRGEEPEFRIQNSEFRINEIPVSNAQVAQKVIELALENAGVPYGKGTLVALQRSENEEVSYKVDGDSEEDNLLRIIALEFLLKHGYRVSEFRIHNSEFTIPVIRFSLDTLYVNLYPRLDPRLDRGGSRTTKMSKLTRRHSEAHIKIVFLIVRAEHVQPLLPEFKKVYKGRGVMEDTFPSYMLESVGEGESFTTIFPAQDRIIKNVQPFLLGITITALVWLLYSYRG